MFRTDYELRHDGWVYDVNRRILWSPPFSRPGAPSALLKTHNDRLTILTNVEAALFIDLAPMDYSRKRDLAPLITTTCTPFAGFKMAVPGEDHSLLLECLAYHT
ncbi:hypothetical protein BJ138DRAFT_1106722 [Hygrophoropsis aurantiaca]|uniref:Uncharacterized protein n=1 Tax=Hygrophoropsis aurantiaca TaxID=72124 RepID=A0ACB7ZV09_9AGAM|nr:hypothetical protein BJ138DRAFT_1106722 [Hygrophoropsis aurantiaca]